MDHVVPERLRDREMVVRYVSRAGQSRFHGGSHLKGSQSYPAGFLGVYLYQNAPWFCYLFSCFPWGCQTLYHLLSHHCHLRFGRALSMVRSANMKKNKRLALEFMRRARKTTNALDSRVRTLCFSLLMLVYSSKESEDMSGFQNLSGC